MIHSYELIRAIQEARAMRDQILTKATGDDLIRMLLYMLMLERLWCDFAFQSLARKDNISECREHIIRGMKTLLDQHGIENPDMPMLDMPTTH